MVSTFPEDITDARSSEQLGARLKDTTDSPNIATFNPEAAAFQGTFLLHSIHVKAEKLKRVKEEFE